MRSPKKPAIFGAAGLTVLSLAALPTAAFAFDPRVEQEIRHFIECATWMIQDPPRYVENCTPSRPAEIMEAPTPNPPGATKPSSSSELPSTSSISSSYSEPPSDPSEECEYEYEQYSWSYNEECPPPA